MSQERVAPADMARIARVLSDVIDNAEYHDRALVLLEEGWIDVAWAADHTEHLELNELRAQLSSES